MKYEKPHTTFREQIKLLLGRGLIINDMEAAEKTLQHISYYRFSAYGLPFQTVKDKYDKGVTFDKILQLYRFDHELRMLCFDILEHIEVALRTQITYTFSQLFGPFGHTDAKNFSDEFDHANWFKKVEEEMDRAKETFIQHYKRKYTESRYLPLWMATEVFSFGSLSKMFGGMTRKSKRTVSSKYEIDDKILGNWLHVLVYLRNLCAHHARLWNRDLSIRPSFPNNKDWDNVRGSVRHEKIFAVFVIISHILNKIDSPFVLTAGIRTLLNKYPEIKIDQMGFPSDWPSILVGSRLNAL